MMSKKTKSNGIINTAKLYGSIKIIVVDGNVSGMWKLIDSIHDFYLQDIDGVEQLAKLN